ncbi:MAG TPA: 30S ribosomal protein S6 [Lentimicrobium sp.]|nr:30S ribosomal protein S6 [Lentimicrobium sp.]
MLKNYETVFIMTPVLSDEQMKEAVAKFQKLLKDKGAEIIHEDHWGLRKLAYPIQKKTSGFYHLIEFKSEGSLINDLEVAFKRDERILRFLSVSLDKHAVAYNEKKRLNKAASPAQEIVTNEPAINS